MGWSLGYENGRDIGYGVPAICDHPKCNNHIDRGIRFRCGKLHTDKGCGLFFCSKHRVPHSFIGEDSCEEVCKRCDTYKEPFDPKPDVWTWVYHKLRAPSWQEWRDNNKEKVEMLAKEYDFTLSKEENRIWKRSLDETESDS